MKRNQFNKIANDIILENNPHERGMSDHYYAFPRFPNLRDNDGKRITALSLEERVAYLVGYNYAEKMMHRDPEWYQLSR